LKNNEMSGDVVQMVEHLPSKHKALSSKIPVPQKKKVKF
jgi:hypothetical protein